MSLFPELSGARFSACNTYRTRLWRVWDQGRPRMAWLMLNPSTADAERNDPTVERCEQRARRYGFGGLEVINLFSLRSTDPQALYRSDDPIGPDNDQAILEVATTAGMLVCAWSAHGRHLDRDATVLQMLRDANVTLYVLQINSDGTPRHPLYVSYDREPVPWRASM